MTPAGIWRMLRACTVACLALESLVLYLDAHQHRDLLAAMAALLLAATVVTIPMQSRVIRRAEAGEHGPAAASSRRLGHRELRALFWVALAGGDARARLRFVLASRKQARRERFRQRVAAAAEVLETQALMRAGFRGGAGADRGASGMLPELRRTRRAEALVQAGTAQSAGFGSGLDDACDLGFAGHEILWVEGRGVTCHTCEQARRRARLDGNPMLLKPPECPVCGQRGCGLFHAPPRH